VNLQIEEHLILGLFLVLFLGIKGLFKRIQIAPVVGFLLFGWGVRLFDERFLFITPKIALFLENLSKIGLILLLFQIGLEAHVKKLLTLLPKVWLIALGNVIFSILPCIFVSLFFGFSLNASLFIALVLLATSIAVSAAALRKGELAESKTGALMLDLSLIDDLAAIFFMILLFHGLNEEPFYSLALPVFLLTLALFALFCYLFSSFIEPLLMQKLIRYEKMPDSMISVIGMGLIIASIAALLNFSLAIGAFFAGMAFSRDPKAVKMDASMQAIFDFFIPFFFFYVGYRISLPAMEGSWLFFMAILGAAILGKLIGNYYPARWSHLSVHTSLLIAVSRLPRAEASIIVLDFASQKQVLSQGVYSALSLTILFTSLLTPFGVRLVRRLKPLSSV